MSTKTMQVILEGIKVTRLYSTNRGNLVVGERIGDRVLVEFSRILTDTDALILTDECGYRFKRVIDPAFTCYVFDLI
jgi:hypothetical protein